MQYSYFFNKNLIEIENIKVCFDRFGIKYVDFKKTTEF